MKVLLAVILTLSVGFSAQDRWYPNFYEGLKVARETNRLIMIYFYEETCTYCKYMEDNVFPDPNVHDYLSKNFVVVPIDVEDPPDNLDRRLRAFGTPHFMFYDPFRKKVIMEVIGLQETDDFLRFLRSACRKFERRQC